MEEKEELIQAIKELQKEVNELKTVLMAIVEMIAEPDYDDEPPLSLTRDEIQKLFPSDNSPYN